jgi:hypothetical protein
VIVSPPAFVEVIGDIGREVRGLAVLTDDDAVFVISELRAAKPGRAVLHVENSALAEHVEGSAYAAAVDEALL